MATDIENAPKAKSDFINKRPASSSPERTTKARAIQLDFSISQAPVLIRNRLNPSFKNLPIPVWDRLALFLPFSCKVQVSRVCKEWRGQIVPYLWRKPSRRWFADIIRKNAFLEGITTYRSCIRNLDSIPVCPKLLFQSINLIYKLEGLVLNCSQPYIWQDQDLLRILNYPYLPSTLKHLVIYDLSESFSSWQELSSAILKLNNLVLLTLPLNFPYDTNFNSLPSSLRFLNCMVDQKSYANLKGLDFSQFLGLTIKFKLTSIISLEELLSNLKRLTTLSLEGEGIVTKLSSLNSPRNLTGLKININTDRDDLLALLRRCRNLEHIELCNGCCDDRTLKLLIRFNTSLKVLKLTNTSVTTLGIASIFKTKAPIRNLDIQCHHENCGPYNLDLNKCMFLNKLTHLRIDLTLYTTIKFLKALKHMKSVMYIDITISPVHLGNMDCHAIFTPALPYLSFFPVDIQMDYLISNWSSYFDFSSHSLTTFYFRFLGNPIVMDRYLKPIQSLFSSSLSCFPCINYPLLIFLNQVAYPQVGSYEE